MVLKTARTGIPTDTKPKVKLKNDMRLGTVSYSAGQVEMQDQRKAKDKLVRLKIQGRRPLSLSKYHGNLHRKQQAQKTRSGVMKTQRSWAKSGNTDEPKHVYDQLVRKHAELEEKVNMLQRGKAEAAG